MKKFLAALILGALLIPTLAFGATETSTRYKRAPITWVTNSATASNGGRLDSTAITITGTPTLATIDTTAWINIDDWAWGHGAQISLGTTFNEAKLIIWGTTITSIDSLPFAIDAKIDGAINMGDFSTNGATCLSSTAGTVDGLLTSNLLSINVAGTPSSAVMPFGAQQIRFRVKCDGNSGARLFGAKAELIYPGYDPPSVNRRIEWRTVNVPWAIQRTGYMNGELGPVDSARTLNGAVAQIDTTAWFSLANLAWDIGQQTSMQTAFGLGRVHVVASGNDADVDTLFYFADFSQETGATKYSQATVNNMVLTAAGDAFAGGALNADIDAPLTTSQVPWGVRNVRFRVRADGNVDALSQGVRVYVTLPFYAE